MGGTFDPIHIGHLFIAEEARVRCGLREVVFFPNRQPAHKEGKTAAANPETRYRLTELAVQSNEFFRVSRVEIDRPGPSYAIDTLGLLRAEYGEAAEFYFIMGADSIGEVLTWHRGEELFGLCRFIAANRPDFDLETARARLSPAQLERVEWLDVPGLDLASRELRQRVRDGRPIRYLVPAEVEAEIARCGLYRTPAAAE